MLKCDFQKKEAKTKIDREGEKQIESINSVKQLSSGLPTQLFVKKKMY